jgi:hypothetical protein
MMDTLLPKERNNSDAFPLAVPDALSPTNDRDKTFPEQEIRDLLLTHAVTKVTLRRVRDSVYLMWLETTTHVIYTSIFGANEADLDPVEATKRAKYIRTKLAAPGTTWWGLVPVGYILNFIQMATEDASWSLGQIMHQSAVDFLGYCEDEASLRRMAKLRSTYIWDVIFERLVNEAHPERTEKLENLRDAWEECAGNTSALDVASWFNWLDDYNADRGGLGGHWITLPNGQQVHFPSRQQIMLAWIHDASTPPDLVAQVQTSLTTLCGEYQTMVRVTGMLKEEDAFAGAHSPSSTSPASSASPRMAESDHRGRKMTNSYVKSLECLLSPTMEPRPDRVRHIAPETTTAIPGFVHADNSREKMSTCFAGDVVRLGHHRHRWPRHSPPTTAMGHRSLSISV